MKLNYYDGTDSLYIDLSSAASTDSREIADGLVFDLDDAGHIVGIDIQHAAQGIDFSSLESNHPPFVTSIT